MKSVAWIWYLFAGAGWLGASFRFFGSWNLLIQAALILFLVILFFANLIGASGRPFWEIAILCLLIFGISGINASWRTQSVQSDSNTPSQSTSSIFAGPAYLSSDPASIGTGLAFRAEIQHQDKKITAEVFAYGALKVSLRERLAGEWVWLEGRLSADAAGHPDASARLSVSGVGNHQKGPLHFQFANGIRRTLSNGADSLGEEQKALFTGIVYGDDKNQSLAKRELFRSTGLTHIMAVSGQNVALVLAVFYPLAKKLANSLRLVIFVVVLGIFLTITRFEPSVVRASAMAFIAFLATQYVPKRKIQADVENKSPPLTIGSIMSYSIQPKAVLGISVLGLIFVSPEIVERLAFQLSVLATAGIVFLSAPIANRLVGPGWFRLPLAITISAQLAVAPLLTFVFGGVAVASLPANMLALPAVSLAMVWGMTAGVAAGILEGVSGGMAGQIIHFPSRLFLGWIDGVAGWSQSLGLGWLGYWHILLLFICLLLSVFLTQRFIRIVLGVTALLVLFLPAVFLRLGDSEIQHLGSKSIYWREHNLLVVDGEIRGTELLKGLRQTRISTIDLAVFLERPRNGIQEALEKRYKINNLWAPSKEYIPGADYPSPGSVYSFGDLVLRVVSNGKQLQFQASHKTKPDDLLFSSDR